MNKEKNKDLAQRLNLAILSLGWGGKTFIAKKLDISRQSVSNCCRRGYLNKINLAKVSVLTGYNLQWLITGEGESRSPNARVYSDTVRSYLDDILDACDDAMSQLEQDFNDQEELDIYIDGIVFAGKQRFSKELITQYVKEKIGKKQI